MSKMRLFFIVFFTGLFVSSIWLKLDLPRAGLGVFLLACAFVLNLSAAHRKWIPISLYAAMSCVLVALYTQAVNQTATLGAAGAITVLLAASVFLDRPAKTAI